MLTFIPTFGIYKISQIIKKQNIINRTLTGILKETVQNH